MSQGFFWELFQQSKKFKRLKKAQGVSEEEPSGFSDEEEIFGSGKSGRTAEEKLKRSLFGDDEGIFFSKNNWYMYLLAVD